MEGVGVPPSVIHDVGAEWASSKEEGESRALGGRRARRVPPAPFPPAVTTAGAALAARLAPRLPRRGGRKTGWRGQVQPSTHTHGAGGLGLGTPPFSSLVSSFSSSLSVFSLSV